MNFLLFTKYAETQPGTHISFKIHVFQLQTLLNPLLSLENEPEI